MEIRTTEVNGRKVEHKDVIHQTITTRFGFWDRLKILIGKPLIIKHETYTKNDECLIVDSQSRAFVPPIIRKKNRGMIYPIESSK